MTDVQLEILTSVIVVCSMGICLCLGFVAGQRLTQ